jgi:hypothetical protein
MPTKRPLFSAMTMQGAATVVKVVARPQPEHPNA